MDGARDPEPRIGTELCEQVGHRWPCLIVEGLLGAFGDTERGAASPVPGVDIGAVLDEGLHQLRQAAEGGAMQRSEVAFVPDIHIRTRLEEDSRGLFRHRLAERPRGILDVSGAPRTQPRP